MQPTGTPAEHFWRWKNAEYDALVDEMGRTAPDDPKLVGLFREAMAIWLREMPSVPLLQWYHRIPHNETYWTNWPAAENPCINSAYWHRTWLLVLLGLEPVQGWGSASHAAGRGAAEGARLLAPSVCAPPGKAKAAPIGFAEGLQQRRAL